jgi:hypothetical protein
MHNLPTLNITLQEPVLSPVDPSKKLHGLVKKLRDQYPEPSDAAAESRPEGIDPLVWQLVFSFMVWEASAAKAAAAAKKLHCGVIDHNEMRVCLADELVHMIGDRYPRAVERVQRLRSVLNDIYRREHIVCLQHLPAMPKRDARAYLDALEGMHPFVSARMTLLCFGGHAFPLDERLHAVLLEEQAAPEMDVDSAAGWLERTLHAGELSEPYLLLEMWMNDRPPPKSRRAPGGKPAAKAEEPKAERGSKAPEKGKPKKTSKP